MVAKSRPVNLTRESTSHDGFGYIIQPENSASSPEMTIASMYREIGKRAESASKHWETGARSTESTCRGEV